ncbi:MAG: substrate-binding domain-containing protein [Saccharofermentanales bacterium]|jgi:ribose transport system substrate-binding protein
MKKRILLLLMALVMSVSLLACSKSKDADDAKDKDAKKEEAAETEAKKEEAAETEAEKEEAAETEAEKEEAAETEAEKEEAEKEEAATDEQISVILVTMDGLDAHWVNVNAGAEQAAEEFNVDFQWMAPDKKDTALQIEILNNAIASGPDALIVAAVDPNAIVDTLKQADEAGIKIFYADSRAEYDAIAAFATDNFAAGKVAGEQMLQGLAEKGIEEGDIGIVAFSSATQTSVDREGGFREAFEGSNFNLLETQYGDSEVAASQAAAENFITQNVVGVYGNNEPGAVGVGNAVAANKAWDGVAVGFDASQVTLDQVEQGDLYCVIAQNPKEMGYQAVSAAVKVMNGEEIAEKIIDTGSSVVNKDNISDFR